MSRFGIAFVVWLVLSVPVAILVGRLLKRLSR